MMDLSLALLLLIIISNVAIDKSQGHRYCSLLANASYCTNSSSHVDCREHSCKAYSCILQSPGCSCMIASYNCSSSCNYEAPPNFCSCTADTCLCLNGVYSTVLKCCPCVSYGLFIHDLSQFFPSRYDEYFKQHKWECGNEFLQDDCFSINVIKSLLKSNDFSFNLVIFIYFFPLVQLTAEDIVNFVDRIANMAGLMSTEVSTISCP